MQPSRHYIGLITIWLAATFALAACDTFTVPEPTPTRQLSGATLAPTINAIIQPPTEVPSGFTDPAGASDPTAAALPNNDNLPPLAVPGQT
ncbi:MAG: hypothetical protein AAF125_26650, partial [Chloroflexota bacterium]